MIERVRLDWRYFVYVYYDGRPGNFGVPIYVGKGSKRIGSLEHKRAYSHWRLRSSNKFLQRVLDKHRKAGVEPRIELVAIFETEVAAHALEVELIATYGRRDLRLGSLLNLTDGGEGVRGRVISDAWRKKIAVARRRGIDKYWSVAANRAKAAKRFRESWAAKSPDARASWVSKIVAALARYWSKPENKVRIAGLNKARWADASYKENTSKTISEALKHYFRTAEGLALKQHLSGLIQKGTEAGNKLMAARWTPENRKRQSDYAKRVSVKFLREAQADPKVRAKMSRAFKAWWAVPENREKRIAAIMAPEAVATRAKKHSKIMRERFKDPVLRAAFVANLKKGWTPEVIARATKARTAAIKKRWEDPTFRLMMLTAFAKGQKRHRARLLREKKKL